MLRHKPERKKNGKKARKTRPSNLGTGDEPRSQPVVVDHGDGGLVAVEGDVAVTAQQAEDSHGAILIAHGDVDAVGRRAEEGHLVLLALQDQDLYREREEMLDEKTV